MQFYIQSLRICNPNMERKTPSLLRQILILTYKNCKVLLGSKVSASFYILSPVFLCLIMYHQQSIANNYVNQEETLNPATYKIESISKCKDINCSTLIFGFTHGNTE